MPPPIRLAGRRLPSIGLPAGLPTLGLPALRLPTLRLPALRLPNLALGALFPSALPLIVLAGLAGYLVTSGYFVCRYACDLAGYQALVSQPPAVVLWTVAIAAEVGVSAAILAALVARRRTFAAARSGPDLGFYLAIAALLLILLMVALGRPAGSVAVFRTGPAFVATVALFCAVPLVACLAAIVAIGKRAGRDLPPGTDRGAALLAIRDGLEAMASLALAAGVIVGGSVLCTVVQQRALAGPGTLAPAAAAGALAYGVVGSLVIALAAVPAGLHVRQRVNRLLAEEAAAHPDRPLQAWIALRDQAAAAGIRTADGSLGLREAIAVALPALSGLASLLV